jgi:hypothetical protein
MTTEYLTTIDLKISALMAARMIEGRLTDKSLSRFADRVISSPGAYENPSELVDCIITVPEALRHG